MKRLSVILIMLIATVPGCGGSSDQTSMKPVPPLAAPKRPEVSTAPPLAIPPAPTAKVGPRYDPTGKPDPFQPPVLDFSLSGETPGRKRMPLEQSDVHEYQLVGIISRTGGMKAMVQDPAGKGYILEIGTKIGKNQGRVVAITEKQVLVEEKTKDFLGRVRAKVVILKIPQTP